jgi:hypothetical protein
MGTPFAEIARVLIAAEQAVDAIMTARHIAVLLSRNTPTRSRHVTCLQSAQVGPRRRP